MDACADDFAALADGAQCDRYQSAHGGEDNRDIKLVGRGMQGRAGPDTAERPGECLPLGITIASEGVDFGSLPLGDLRQDVRRRDKPVEANTLALAGQPLCPPADKTGTEQWGSFNIRKAVWQLKAVTRVGDEMCRVAAIPGRARETGVIAQVFTAG
jgi:hypothetical protein